MKFTEIIDPKEFKYFEFKDADGINCTLQNSSAVDPHIRLGVDDVNPISGRMHLNVEHAKFLIQKLQEFVNYDSIYFNK